jgi:hypothetical protein
MPGRDGGIGTVRKADMSVVLTLGAMQGREMIIMYSQGRILVTMGITIPMVRSLSTGVSGTIIDIKGV